jgi:predicted DNA repair protein MutK
MPALIFLRPFLPYLAAALLLTAGIWWLRHDAATRAVSAIQTQEAQQDAQATHKGDAAAVAAERDGAASRLRDGAF